MGPFGSEVLVSRLIARTLAADQTPRHPAARTERERILRLFCEEFGDRRAASLVSIDLVEFIRKQPGLRSNWSRSRWAATVKQVFGLACKLGLLAHNPFRGVSFGQGGRGRDLTDAEFRTLLRGTTAPFRRLLLFCRLTGARPGEARQVAWSELRVENGSIVLRNHKTSRRTGRARPLFLPPVAVRLLAWIRRQPWNRDVVFLNHYGQPWTRAAIVQRVERLRKRLGLPADVRMYSVRHTFATRAICRGVDVATLAELMGHASIMTTQWYVHLAGKDDHLRAAVAAATSGALGASPRGPSQNS